jgi:hypothetical protein
MENSFARFAVLTACLEAEWLDPGVALPEDDCFVRSDAMPAPETERRAKLTFNKNSHPSIGDLLWVLFVPGLGAENGWRDHPETISNSAFVHCRLTAIETQALRHGATWMWIRVAIDRVIPFSDLEEQFPAQRMTRLETWRLSTGSLVRSDGWELWWAPHDDAGFWLLARRNGQEAHVLAGGEWVLDDHVAWAGHVVLPVAEWERICGHSCKSIRRL